MIFLLDKISQLKFGWNEKQLTEQDFFKLCRKYKVKVVEMPLQVDGFYYCVKGKHYIALDSKLRAVERLFTMFHEFAHFIYHVPDTNVTANFSRVGERNFKEEEADLFALCALIPKDWVENKTLKELLEEEFLPEEMLWKRKEIYDKYDL